MRCKRLSVLGGEHEGTSSDSKVFGLKKYEFSCVLTVYNSLSTLWLFKHFFFIGVHRWRSHQSFLYKSDLSRLFKLSPLTQTSWHFFPCINRPAKWPVSRRNSCVWVVAGTGGPVPISVFPSLSWSHQSPSCTSESTMCVCLTCSFFAFFLILISSSNPDYMSL